MTLTLTKYLPDYCPSIAIDADGNTPPIKMLEANRYSFQINMDFDSGDAAGNVSLQYSLDGTNWATDSDSTVAYTNALTEAIIFRVVLEADYWVRIAFSDTSGTGGTAEVIAFYKYI